MPQQKFSLMKFRGWLTCRKYTNHNSGLSFNTGLALILHSRIRTTLLIFELFSKIAVHQTRYTKQILRVFLQTDFSSLSNLQSSLAGRISRQFLCRFASNGTSQAWKFYRFLTNSVTCSLFIAIRIPVGIPIGFFILV